MKKLVILTCLLCALPLWGQTYYRDDGWVQTPLGQAVPGASVAICTQPATTTTQPCSTLASLYAAGTSNSTTLTGASWAGQQIRFIFASVPSDIVANSYFTVSGASPAGYNGTWLVVQVTGTTITVASTANPGTYVSGGAVATSALPNPIATDGNGHYFFYTTPALYTIQIYSGQIAQQVYPDQHINGAPGAGSGTVTSVAATVPSWLSVAGSPIVASGTLAITAATGQTSHLVIGSCGAATTFTPCSLVEADLPATTVFTDQSATFGAHAYDFSGVTLAKLRVSGGLTTSANGDIGYDSTGGNWHAYASSADNILLRTPASGTFTNNDCVKFSLTGSALTAVDAGAPCGSGRRWRQRNRIDGATIRAWAIHHFTYRNDHRTDCRAYKPVKRAFLPGINAHKWRRGTAFHSYIEHYWTELYRGYGRVLLHASHDRSEHRKGLHRRKQLHRDDPGNEHCRLWRWLYLQGLCLCVLARWCSRQPAPTQSTGCLGHTKFRKLGDRYGRWLGKLGCNRFTTLGALPER